jgi:hypothetical protein
MIFQAGQPGVQGNDATHSRLGEAVSQLRKLSYLADNSPGKICVTDTNSLMHYQPFNQFDWCGRLGVTQVRLVIPVAVVAEIDNKKYARRTEFWTGRVTCWR